MIFNVSGRCLHFLIDVCILKKLVVMSLVKIKKGVKMVKNNRTIITLTDAEVEALENLSKDAGACAAFSGIRRSIAPGYPMELREAAAKEDAKLFNKRYQTIPSHKI